MLKYETMSVRSRFLQQSELQYDPGLHFAVSGKFGAIFASIPIPIMAASYCIFFGYVCMYQSHNLTFHFLML